VGLTVQARQLLGAEMYDPFAGTWSLVQANIVLRLGHAAALLHDGRVLVVGGAASAASCQLIGSAELYEPSIVMEFA
jgi:large repetitive protein